jgi:hypothetical protein
MTYDESTNPSNGWAEPDDAWLGVAKDLHASYPEKTDDELTDQFFDEMGDGAGEDDDTRATVKAAFARFRELRSPLSPAPRPGLEDAVYAMRRRGRQRADELDL